MKKLLLITEEVVPPRHRFSQMEKSAEHLCKDYDIFFVHPHPEDNFDLISLPRRIRTQLDLIDRSLGIIFWQGVDLLYTGSWSIALALHLLTRKPYVLDCPEFFDQMYWEFRMPLRSLLCPVFKVLQTLAVKWSKATITQSSEACAVWMSRGIPADKLHYAPYGVDVDHIRGGGVGIDFRARYSILGSDTLVVFHGDIGEDDGLELLMEKVKVNGWWLIIAGGGRSDYIQELKEKSSRQIIFIGWLPYSQIPDLLRAADYVAGMFKSTLYTNTAVPLKVLEGVAAGKPILSEKMYALSKYLDSGKVDVSWVRRAEKEREILSKF